MPLTDFQSELARLLAGNRSPDSYLAGGAALHFEPNSKRTSNDLDYFHDSVERVATAFTADRDLLTAQGYVLSVQLTQPGFVRAIVAKGEDATKVEWAHDSAWRFMPTEVAEDIGYRLHPIDLAVNKVLALAGRNEARDFFDVIHIQRDLLPLGPLCWAAAGKDPGFTPLSLLDLLARRGRYQPEDFERLHLAVTVELPALKTEWLAALEGAERFARARPPDQVGCLYYSPSEKRFVDPETCGDAVPHFGRPGGVLPAVGDGAAQRTFTL